MQAWLRTRYIRVRHPLTSLAGGSPTRERSAIALIGSIAVLIGLGDLPYGYYTLLRLVLCGVCLFLLFSSRPIQIEWQRWVTGGCAFLYNPLLPVRIGDKGVWIVLNIMTVAWLWFLARSGDQRGAG